jgi:hypothetical protein
VRKKLIYSVGAQRRRLEMKIDWLPELVTLEEYGGNWENYLEVLYSLFKDDFINNQPSFRGVVLGLKRYPLIKDKEATFWHIISEGAEEIERLPDLRRCERIRWPKPVIKNCADIHIKLWENERKGEKRVCLWLEEEEYLVVLAERKEFYLLWTAYLVKEGHQKRKLEKEYCEWKKAEAAR